MQYVMDTSSIILLSYYYPELIPSFWKRFDRCVEQGEVVSVSEVRGEFHPQAADGEWLNQWVQKHSHMFLDLGREEAKATLEVFNRPYFNGLISERAGMQKNPVADPFVIAKAWHLNGTVITEELHKEKSSVKMPTVCKELGIRCMKFRGFLQEKGWTF